jgi:hypothetical protein
MQTFSSVISEVLLCLTNNMNNKCAPCPPSPTFQQRWVQHQGDVGVAESGVATSHSEPSVHQAANVIKIYKKI